MAYARPVEGNVPFPPLISILWPVLNVVPTTVITSFDKPFTAAPNNVSPWILKWETLVISLSCTTLVLLVASSAVKYKLYSCPATICPTKYETDVSIPAVVDSSRNWTAEPATNGWTSTDENVSCVLISSNGTFSDIISNSAVNVLSTIVSLLAPPITWLVAEFQASADISLNSVLNSLIMAFFSANVKEPYIDDASTWACVISANTSPIERTSFVLSLILFWGAASKIDIATLSQSTDVSSLTLDLLVTFNAAFSASVFVL